jgi:hypothetical protein
LVDHFGGGAIRLPSGHHDDDRRVALFDFDSDNVGISWTGEKVSIKAGKLHKVGGHARSHIVDIMRACRYESRGAA